VADFGSADREFIKWQELSAMDPDLRSKIVNKAYESFEKNTTLMYRPPEMLDKYLKMDVDLSADIWMLGCILFTLCFGKQPFQEA
jgi:serine/threonine protein kinase